MSEKKKNRISLLFKILNKKKNFFNSLYKDNILFIHYNANFNIN